MQGMFSGKRLTSIPSPSTDKCKLTSPDEVPDEWLKDGVLIEMLSGFRVLAVGRIIK